jgi:cytochrome c553
VTLRILRNKLVATLVAASFFLTAGVALAQAKDSIAQRFALCTTCHGEGGVSTQPLIPSLAGQPSFYAITQLFLFREGRRSSEAMTAVAKGMSDDDLRGFSDFIGTLPPPPPATNGAVDSQRMARGAVLAQQHRCASCHGADYAGGQQVARLAYQREDYLSQTLQEFRAARRIGYTQAMNEALAGIAPEALQDLAYYLARLPATAQ